MNDVEIRLPEAILKTAHIGVKNLTKKYMKDGIVLEKGAVFTKERIEQDRELLEKYFNFWSVYPDRFVDFITPSTSHFQLFLYQRLFLRACCRYGRVCVIAPRALN